MGRQVQLEEKPMEPTVGSGYDLTYAIIIGSLTAIAVIAIATVIFLIWRISRK